MNRKNDVCICCLCVSLMYYVALMLVLEPSKVLSDSCASHCTRMNCQIFVHGTGEKIEGPCQCSSISSTGHKSIYCSNYMEEENPPFLKSHPYFWRQLPFLIVGFLIVAAAYVLLISEIVLPSIQEYLRARKQKQDDADMSATRA